MMNEPQTASEPVAKALQQPVLVGIDFSEDSRAALLWACRLAACTESRLILLHVVHDPASSPGFYSKTKKGKLRPMQAVAENMMVEFVDQTIQEHPDLPGLATCEMQFIPGLPPTRIVEVSNLLNAGVIVVGNRGITGFPHILLGSVAERVVKLSKRPVVVVKAEITQDVRQKELEKQQKRIKKDRKWLKELLGIRTEGNADG